MIDERVAGFREAVEGLESGHSVMVGGFGDAGVPGVGGAPDLACGAESI